MAFELEGSVQAKRIYEYLTKVLGVSDLATYELLIDKSGNSTANKITLEHLLSFAFGGIYEPTTEPVIVTGTPNELTISLNNSQQSAFEPRLSTGTQAINVDFDLLITNDTSSLLFSSFFRLTGTRVITFESDVKVSIPSSLGSWAAPDLTISAGTDDDILFVFQKNKTGNFWDLSVNEKSV